MQSQRLQARSDKGTALADLIIRHSRPSQAGCLTCMLCPLFYFISHSNNMGLHVRGPKHQFS